MASEQEIPYEETRHLFDPDQDGKTCQHVWRWTENHLNRHQITRVCVICHASSGFPADEGFLRSRYIQAENANLRHYLKMKQFEQERTQMRELLETALTWLEGEWNETSFSRQVATWLEEHPIREGNDGK